MHIKISFPKDDGNIKEKVNGGYALTANVRWSYVVRLAMRYNGKKRIKIAALCAITTKVYLVNFLI